MAGPRPDFEHEVEAHRHFSAECFNRCWDLIDLPERTADETIEMLALAWASTWHWTRRPDFSGKRIAVAYWLLARVHALAGQAAPAREHAERSRIASEGLPPYYAACAEEALARAAAVAGDAETRDRHRERGRRIAATIAEAPDRDRVLADLESLP